MLSRQNPSLQPSRASQKVRVADHVRFGVFDVGVRVAEFAFIKKQ